MCLIVIRRPSHTSWCRICQSLLIWKWGRLLKRGIRKPLMEWQTIQWLIENGTKRQHATEQLSLIPINNRGELRTQVI